MPPPLPATGARGHHHLQLLFSNSQHTSQSGNGHDKADLPQVRGSKGPVISYSPTKSWEMAGTVSEPTWAAAQLLSSKTNFQASAKPRICVRFCMTKKKKKKKDVKTIPHYNLGVEIHRQFYLTSQDLAPALEKNQMNWHFNTFFSPQVQTHNCWEKAVMLWPDTTSRVEG